MYGRSRVSVKVERGLTLHVAFHTLPLFHLCTYNFRAFARKNYVTVQINPYSAEREERRSPTRNARDEHSERDPRKEK